MSEYLPYIIPILSLILTAFIWFYFNKKFESYKIKTDKKIISYSELINFSRAFTKDPSLSYDENVEMAKNFITKYHNEILPFAPKDVVYSIQDFLYNSWTNYLSTSRNNQTKSLFNIIKYIRKDLGLEPLDLEKIEFHSINEINFKKHTSK